MTRQNKNNSLGYVTENTLDMSMLQLTDLPPKNKMILPKNVNSLNLSNNMLITIAPYLCTLIQIRELDLSKNKLNDLPFEFGDLANLRKLDLYDNQLTYLPMSFHKLKKLKWLDISSNPIPQALLNIAGPCQNAKECEHAAQNVVKYFGVVNIQISKEFEKAKKALKERAATETLSEPTAQGKSKKNRNKDSDKANVNDIKEVQNTDDTVEAKTVGKPQKCFSILRYVFIYIFAFAIMGCIYVWVDDIDVHGYIQCLKTGQNCTQLLIK